MAKKAQKKKKKKGGKLLGLLIIVAIIVVGFLVFKSYQKCNVIKDDAITLSEKFNDKFNDITLTNNLDLFESDSEYIKLNWISSNTEYLKDNGEIIQPSGLIGDVEVTLTCEIELVNINVIDTFLIDNFAGDFETIYSFKFTIPCKELTEEEKISLYFNSLYIPNTLASSINLPINFGEASCQWESSDTSILDNNGNIIGNGEVALKCTLSINDKNVEKTYSINVSSEPLSNNLVYDFSDYNKSKYIGEANYKDLVISNAINNEGSLKFKLEDELSYILTGEIKDADKISFKYQDVTKGAGFTYEIKVSLLYSSDALSYSEVKSEIITDSEIHEFVYESVSDGYYKVLLTSEYASRNISIDDLTIYRNIGFNEAVEALLDIIPSSVKNSYELPFTTPYGGVVSYTYDSNDFIQTDETKEINLKINVSGFSNNTEFDYLVKLVGKNVESKVEVRFIDLSKYGGYNDCGESIYIKYDSYDILIDGGDNYSETVKAVEEVINTYSNDKILDLVIATHPDSDHIGGLDSIILDFEVLSIIEFSGDASTQVYKNYNEAVKNENAQVCTGLDSYNNANGCSRKINISDDGEVYLEVLNTGFYETEENNSRSVVTLLTAYGTRILFTGDADNAKYDIEENYKNSVGNIDILKVVHHGTSNGTTLDYVKAIDPEVAIICNGNYLGNKHGHPTYEAISNLYAYDSEMKVYAITGGDAESCSLGTSYKCSPTDYTYQRNGMITVTIDNNGYSITSELNGDKLIEIKDTDYYKSRVALEK